MKASRNYTQKISIPRTKDGCSVAITASFGEGISVANLLGTDHFPKGGINNQATMILYRIPHGEFVGGITHTRISPSITTSSFNENNFIIKIRKIDEKADENNQASVNPEGRSFRTTEEGVLNEWNITDPVRGDGKGWRNCPDVSCRKAVLKRERTEFGREMRHKYDNHQAGFSDDMKTRNPRLDGLSNTLTSFTTDNLVLIVRRHADRRKENGTPSTIWEG